MFVENNDYEILTPTGWQDFKGVSIVTNKVTFRIIVASGKFIEATAGHYFFTSNTAIQVKDLQVGDSIDTIDGLQEIVNIEELAPTTVFDIIEVRDSSHQFIASSYFKTKNCDEFAHLAPNIAEDFWTSISPTLSTGGRAIITSTPNSDEDMFAQIWKEANMKFDEYGNETEVGKNGFFPYRSYWREHPDRDDKWAAKERGKIGPARFLREFECCADKTTITLQDESNVSFTTTIGELYRSSKEDENLTFKPNTKNFKVLTPSGFQPFAGVALMNYSNTITLHFEQNAHIECTYDHKFYVKDTQTVTADQLNIGDTVLTSNGDVRLLHKIPNTRLEPVYDLIEVGNGHKYYTNTLVSSNCEFIVYDETLISNLTLAELQGISPIMNTGQVRWYKKPTAGNLYVIALDPSLGTGGNSAAIEVLELPSFEQVAEWQHNLTPIQGQIKTLREILKYIEHSIGQENSSSIYWSIENNTVGEAGLICIRDIGEENFPGLFLGEPPKKGITRKYRKGFNTTYGSKISAAARMKYLIESGKLKINSKVFISELKTYIASGVSFKAKSGSEDDLISAMLLIMRMSQVLADWDPRVFDSISTGSIEGEDEWEMPMPIFVSTNL